MSYAVIMEQDSSNDIPIQIQKDADVFVDIIMKNKIDFEQKLHGLDRLTMILKQYGVDWSRLATDIIRFTGFVVMMFNTIMIHFLLNGKISVTVTSIMSIFLSLVGVFLSSTYVFFV